MRTVLRRISISLLHVLELRQVLASSWMRRWKMQEKHSNWSTVTVVAPELVCLLEWGVPRGKQKAQHLPCQIQHQPWSIRRLKRVSTSQHDADPPLTIWLQDSDFRAFCERHFARISCFISIQHLASRLDASIGGRIHDGRTDVSRGRWCNYSVPPSRTPGSGCRACCHCC